jgi:signal peptidase II
LKKYILPAVIIGLVLLADQLLKYWVHTNIPLNTHITVFENWFQLNYIENNGMAFGFEIGGTTGKIILTWFRIIAVFAIVWYLVKQIRIGSPRGFIVCVALILAGAIGNILDSVFYGVVYRSQNLPLFQGRVIDMLYFPIVDTYIPEWFPIWKGERFEFFRPVFNIADAAISTGIIAILLFQKRFFKSDTPQATEVRIEEPATAEESSGSVGENKEGTDGWEADEQK